MNRAARCLYTLIWWLATPLVLGYLWRRGRRQPEYRRDWGERFGRYEAPAQSRPTLWLHAVSVGETRAAAPLVEALLQRHPGHRLLLTQMTPTGRATARQLFGERVELAYLPYDRPDAVARFLDRFRPELGVLLETELWPNLIHACAERGMPLHLVNARLSERSLAGYRRVRGLIAPALARLGAVAAQSADDAERLRSLLDPGTSGPVFSVIGNLKYDFAADPALVARGQTWRAAAGTRPVWLIASSREGEEALLLDALARRPIGGLLVLVPRHPQRFDVVAALLTARGLSWRRRSEWNGADPLEQDVLLGDSLGELAAYLAMADLTVMGGSLLDFGCHNLIEPCAVGVPVLIGPSTFNFAEVVRDALAAGAARQADDADGLLALVDQLLADPTGRAAMAQAGRELVQRNRGALARALAVIEPGLRHDGPARPAHSS
ncbi:lipid IV(A) 3-deoxy-D-manno-octulosonic acid transferase [Chitinimonas lacunae]|uniref:3-deoxy-D-manno-octulosonic acid transferase n=1 Tax=Chitinimonas lacunae TaxID=1963018 RepID=A0ABV8MSN5_9NEIS